MHSVSTPKILLVNNGGKKTTTMVRTTKHVPFGKISLRNATSESILWIRLGFKSRESHTRESFGYAARILVM